jgi:hypothetical protein
VCTAEAIKAAGLSLNDVKPAATAVAAPSSPLNITASRSSSSSSSNSSNRNGGSSSSAAAAAAAAAAARPQKGPSAVQRDAVQPVSIDLCDENSGAATAATAATANGYCDYNDVHTKRQRVLTISSSSNSAFPSRSSFLQQQQQQQQQQQFESSARVPGLWNRSSTTTSAHRAGQALPNTDSWQVLLLLSTTLSLNCMCLCC